MTSGPRRPVGWSAVAALAVLLLYAACIPVGEDTIEVTASAYNSHPNQTDETPYVAARAPGPNCRFRERTETDC